MRQGDSIGCRHQLKPWPLCHTLTGMTTAAPDPLDRAWSLVAGASDQLLGQGDYDSISAVSRCHEVIALLSDCGANGPDEPEQLGTVKDTLTAAARILDDIPDQERPDRWGAARTELAGVMLAVDRSDTIPS